jgi:hypothetical protein
MDRISDADLSWLRGHVTVMKPSAYQEILQVIDELRERRAKDSELLKATDELTEALNEITMNQLKK